MKTVMQELVDKLTDYRNSEIEKHIGPSGLNFAINIATELLEKEKQTIIDARLSFVGLNHITAKDFNEQLLKNAEEYYNQKYNFKP